MRKPVLLLAEDDEDDRFLFSEAVASISPDIHYMIVSNGREVITILKNDFISLPDYILLDLNMPVMNGMECLSAIKLSPVLQEVSVIVYSTTLDKKVEVQLMQAGAYACFVKPNCTQALADVLRKLCNL